MHKKAYKEGLTMKKWYRKTVTRTIVLVVAILSGALLVTNLLSLLTLAGGMSLSQIQKMNTQSFEESEERVLDSLKLSLRYMRQFVI